MYVWMDGRFEGGSKQIPHDPERGTLAKRRVY
jgi:hypothetical protein